MLRRANMCLTRLGKTEGRGEQFVAKRDYYDVCFFFFSFPCDRWGPELLQSKQTGKHPNTFSSMHRELTLRNQTVFHSEGN